jgi:UPF0755 protein
MRRFVSEVVSISAIIIVVIAIAAAASRFHQEPPPVPRVTVTIPEGSTVSDINRILSDAGVLQGEELNQDLEGYLFPDTYEFFIPSGISVIEAKFKENFDKKIDDLSLGDISEEKLANIITIASLVEKEVPNPNDRGIVAGIIEKRLAHNMLLQIDASICYIKESPCLPITEEDKNIDSPYNTYKYIGLPPGPIDNPGIEAIEAAVNPIQTSYWYYISDPETGETIFSKTLDEQNNNIVKYLGN